MFCVPLARLERRDLVRLEWRDGKWDEGWDNIRTIFNKIETLISHYEMKEAMT